jgi:DNA-binding IclR family transcriptional regulator
LEEIRRSLDASAVGKQAAATQTLPQLVAFANKQKGVRAAPDYLTSRLVQRDRDGKNYVRNGIRDMQVTGGDKAPTDITAAGVVTLAACQDHQSSLEQGGHGVFTSVLAGVWNRGQFKGSYRAFHQEILRQMDGHGQDPHLDVFGTPTSTKFVEDESPFQI